jgi:6-phosphogluconolactonase/glucosamine-6-phosphate isomerase/deaminase
MKKYITKEELRDIVADLAEAFMENGRYDVTLSLSHFSVCDDLKVQIQDRESSYRVISSESYSIIEKPSDSFDIVRVIENDIERHEAAMAEINKETESPIEIECA